MVGVAAAAIGLWLIARPLSSLNLLVLTIALTLIINGVGEAMRPPAAWPSLTAGAALVAAGVLIFAYRGFTTSLMAVIIAGAPIIVGSMRIAGAFREEAREKSVALVMGAAAIGAGVVALDWPDVTLLVAAVVFGGWTLVVGLQLAWSAIAAQRQRNSTSIAGAAQRHGRFGLAPRLLGAIAVLVIVAVIGVVSVRLHRGAPNLDDFYAAPALMPSEPGVLVRAEPFTRAMPANARAWRILYTTTMQDGRPALASALVVVPREPPPGPMPLIAWTHGTTGYAQVCAPSLLPDPLVAGAMFNADQVVAHGWALVATDYVGLGTKGPHPYLIGQGEARSALDSIRAVHELKGLDLSDKTVVWGHSQGGHAALWTGGLAPTYAPELNIVGVAALAPASDLEGLVANLGTVRGGALFAAYVLAGYEAAYPDVRASDYADPSARTLLRQFASRCLADPRIYVSIVEALAVFNDRDVFSRPLTTGPMLKRLRENTPTLPIAAPLLIAQGLADPLVVPRVQHDYVQARCHAGQALEYLTIPDKDHVALVEAASPLIPRLFRWTQDRFAGVGAPNDCGSLPGG